MFDCPHCLNQLDIAHRTELYHERKCFAAKERAKHEEEMTAKQDRVLRETWARHYGTERPW